MFSHTTTVGKEKSVCGKVHGEYYVDNHTLQTKQTFHRWQWLLAGEFRPFQKCCIRNTQQNEKKRNLHSTWTENPRIFFRHNNGRISKLACDSTMYFSANPSIHLNDDFLQFVWSQEVCVSNRKSKRVQRDLRDVDLSSFLCFGYTIVWNAVEILPGFQVNGCDDVLFERRGLIQLCMSDWARYQVFELYASLVRSQYAYCIISLELTGSLWQNYTNLWPTIIFEILLRL